MKSFDELVEIVKSLRGPDGCPWDKEQTHDSLTPYAIEEAHELEEAIRRNDIENIKEELGDLLFQSVLHAQIASEDSRFNIDDVLQHLNHKMTSRHPHVFADGSAKNADEVMESWEALKQKEKANQDPMDIPASFPALLRAEKIGRRTKKMKFDWQTAQQVLEKIDEELAELREAIESKDAIHIQEELGDFLFTGAQLARHLKLDAEKTLRLANEKFIARFRAMIARQPDFASLTDQQKEKLWQEVKALAPNNS